jgi:LmbE family N-acetylglucosaminyl deacetylase
LNETCPKHMDSAPSKHANILVVIAHPDDEILVSGTICLCADTGCSITLVCVTDGESGDDEGLPVNSRLTLGEIRQQELELSASALGVNEVLFLHRPDVADPESDGAWNQSELIDALGEIIRERAPALILTHGPRGGYGNLAHRLVYRSVMAAVGDISYGGSVFSFCGKVRGAFSSWHFDQPSDVLIDVRGFLNRRAASLSYHQSQIGFFLRPDFPRTPRKLASAMFGYAFMLFESGRRRVPIVTSSRFFSRYPTEGLAHHRLPGEARSHFFQERFHDDLRVRIVG